MHLGIYRKENNYFDAIRELTMAELEDHETFSRIFIEARSRLVLFRMLERNYENWKAYLNRMLSANFQEDVDVSEELNRLLLNYLTFAYTIQEHFAASFRKRFKSHPERSKEYSNFLGKLCNICWPFAFILDFRGYVQHVGLGIGNISRTSSDTSIQIKVEVSASALLADGCRWKRSGLKASRGDLNLIEILKEFHIQMLQSYGGFVARTFFPELLPASKFYAKLCEEVRERDPDAQMIFFCEPPKFTPGENGKSSVNFNVIAVTNDVFGELGIQVNTSKQWSLARSRTATINL